MGRKVHVRGSVRHGTPASVMMKQTQRKLKYIPLVLAISLVACAQPSNQVAQEETQQEEVKEQLIAPFDPSTATHVVLSDPRAFFGHPRDLLPRIDGKDQFEKTEEYEKRLARERALPLDWDATKSYLFTPLNSHQFDYDADEEVFTQRASRPCLNSGVIGPWNCPLGQLIDTSSSSPSAFNAYGERFNVLISDERMQMFDSRFSWSKRIPTDCHVPLEKAKEIASSFALAHVYKFEEAVMHRGDVIETPLPEQEKVYFYENLGIHGDVTHIVCYDKETGEILHQQKI